jgi:hypothetical protein
MGSSPAEWRIKREEKCTIITWLGCTADEGDTVQQHVGVSSAHTIHGLMGRGGRGLLLGNKHIVRNQFDFKATNSNFTYYYRYCNSTRTTYLQSAANKKYEKMVSANLWHLREVCVVDSLLTVQPPGLWIRIRSDPDPVGHGITVPDPDLTFSTRYRNNFCEFFFKMVKSVCGYIHIFPFKKS